MRCITCRYSFYFTTNLYIFVPGHHGDDWVPNCCALRQVRGVGALELRQVVVPVDTDQHDGGGFPLRTPVVTGVHGKLEERNIGVQSKDENKTG